jgi:hypothetical protein
LGETSGFYQYPQANGRMVPPLGSISSLFFSGSSHSHHPTIQHYNNTESIAKLSIKKVRTQKTTFPTNTMKIWKLVFGVSLLRKYTVKYISSTLQDIKLDELIIDIKPETREHGELKSQFKLKKASPLITAVHLHIYMFT